MDTPVSQSPRSRPRPAGAPGKISTQATLSLVLGIVSLVCCALTGPVAWYLGVQEQKAIDAGQSSPASAGVAKAGMITGIIGTVLLALSFIWIFFFGGMAMLSAIMESGL